MSYKGKQSRPDDPTTIKYIEEVEGSKLDKVESMSKASYEEAKEAGTLDPEKFYATPSNGKIDLHLGADDLDKGSGGSVEVDNVTIGKTSDNKLQVKDGGLGLAKIANQGTEASGKAIGFSPTGEPTLIEVGGGGGETIEVITDAFMPVSSRCTILEQEVQVSSSGWKALRIQFQMTPSFNLARQDEWYNLFQAKDINTAMKIDSKVAPVMKLPIINVKDYKNIDLYLNYPSCYFAENSSTKIYDPVELPPRFYSLQIKSEMGLGDFEVGTTGQDGTPLILQISAFYR